MKEILVGHTGFVGSNILEQHPFDAVFNSKNITEAYGTNPDLCVYAGVYAEKYLAQKNPSADLEIVQNAIHNIQLINPRQLVLISTIDVYPIPVAVDENSQITPVPSNAYGMHRRMLEEWVQNQIPNHLILRLPALFGRNIKKNFIYDLIHVIPSMLNPEKYSELSAAEPSIKDAYEIQNNGFFKCCAKPDQRRALREAFVRCGFTALQFTDSRSSFQFYNLAYLWGHIQISLKNDLHLINLAVEPLFTSTIYQQLNGTFFANELSSKIASYDFRSIHCSLFDGSNGYIFNQDKVMQDLIKFIASEKQKL